MKNITTKNEIEVSVKGACIEDVFVLIEASKLSLDDAFMDYNPTTNKEEEFKKALVEAIKNGIKDFYRPVMDPSFNRDGSIRYVKWKKPAVGKIYNWWKETARNYMPERGSRLGTKTEYIEFLGVLLKKLVDSGWKVEDAWDAVCNDSKKLGHYCNSDNSKRYFEPTGFREIVGYCDLANTYKLLAEDVETGGFWFASGLYDNFSDFSPLADLDHVEFDDDDRNDEYDDSVGWLVLEK